MPRLRSSKRRLERQQQRGVNNRGSRKGSKRSASAGDSPAQLISGADEGVSVDSLERKEFRAEGGSCSTPAWESDKGDALSAKGLPGTGTAA